MADDMEASLTAPKKARHSRGRLLAVIEDGAGGQAVVPARAR
jgi:hypothetical protein